jgi:FkbM family methyltransferase
MQSSFVRHLFYIWGMENENIIINGIHCLPGDTDITEYVRQEGTLKWDRPFDFITKFLGKGDGRVMVDIGAYIGDSAKWFVDDGWECHAFEPQPDAFECLKKNLEHDGAKLYNIPLGSGECVSMETNTEGNLGGRGVFAGGDIPTKKLDDYFERVDFLKIDAEGFEPSVLEGAKNVLSNRPIVAIEVNIPALRNHGWTQFDIYKYFQNYQGIETYRYGTMQYDILFVPNEIASGMISEYEKKYNEELRPFDFSKAVYVILGRFGDIYMVCNKLKQPSIVCCNRAFSKIAKELFPQHEIYEISNSYAGNPLEAAKACQTKFPSRKVIICQQDGQDRALMNKFKSFQSFQEYYASL